MYVVTDHNRSFLGLFTTRELAEESFKASYERQNLDLVFRGDKVYIELPIKNKHVLVGRVEHVPVWDEVVHL